MTFIGPHPGWFDLPCARADKIRLKQAINGSDPLQPCQILVPIFLCVSAALCVNSFSFFSSAILNRMTIAEKIQKDLVDAMRAKDELRLSVLRGVKSAIKYKETEKIHTLDEAETIQILQTLVKQRKESIDQFGKGNRQDLVDKETKELAIL
jgi:hypothetical protein